MAREDGEGAVDLLGKNDAGEGMGQGHGSKRESQLRAGKGGLRPAAGGSDGKDKMLHAGVAPRAEPGRECLGGHLFAAAIEEDDKRPAFLLAFEPREEGFFCFVCLSLAAGKGSEAIEIEAGEGFRRVVGVEPGTDVGEGEEHREEDT